MWCMLFGVHVLWWFAWCELILVAVCVIQDVVRVVCTVRVVQAAQAVFAVRAGSGLLG
jgi:hypothetical protein